MVSFWTVLTQLANIAAIGLFLALEVYAIKALRVYIKKESSSRQDP